MRHVMFGVALALCVPGVASAQVCNAAGIPGSCSPTPRTVQINIRHSVQLTVTPTVSDLGAPTAAHFTQGFMDVLGHTATVKANTGWQLSIRSTRNTWISSGGARNNKPRGDLEFSSSPTGPWTAMPGNNNASAIDMATGGATAGTAVSVYYRVLWSWALDSPGTYSLPVVLRITAP